MIPLLAGLGSKALLLFKNPYVLAIALVVMLAGGYVVKLKHDLSNLTQELTLSQKQALELTNSINKQNVEVERLGRLSIEKEKAATKRAEEKLKAPLPSPTNPGVKSLNKWLEDV